MRKFFKITIITLTLHPLANKENQRFILEIKTETRNLAYLIYERCNVHRCFFTQSHFSMV